MIETYRLKKIELILLMSLNPVCFKYQDQNIAQVKEKGYWYVMGTSLDSDLKNVYVSKF